MGRRRHRRWVSQTPNNFYFSSEPPSENSIVLTIAEFEAMRLKHYLGFNQRLAAEKMGVSQPTFFRILKNAHRKTTIALIEGKSIKIFGGNFDIKPKFMGYECVDCQYEWEDPEASRDRKVTCVRCNSKNVYFLVRELI
ncbi:MAG: DUF134 domain-containing protein [Candidatus Thorarchaeota archaeon]